VGAGDSHDHNRKDQPPGINFKPAAPLDGEGWLGGERVAGG
jgi:hypothetical protein